MPAGSLGRIVAIGSTEVRGERPDMSTRATRHNFGADLTTFIGRTDEVREIRQMLREVRLVTLVGIGGVGKSRIAAAVGVGVHRAFKDGVWRTDFSATQDARFIAQAIQDAIPGPDSVRSLADQIGDQNMLLVFDNCDRMTAALADLSIALLSQCPHLKILATSRTPFEVSPERLFRLTSFALESPVAALHAVELFSDRAHAASGATYDASERAAVADLCARLDGLPLAIELAALRTRTMSVDEISSRLTDRFDLLRGGHRDLHPRHQSLSALLEWTWDQCSVEQRALWAQFSVFAGVATLPALESVCALPGNAGTADVVDELLQQSIIIRRQVGGIVTFRMLDAMREYGEQRLAHESDVLGGLTPEQLRERHMRYYEALAHRTESTWFGPYQKHSSAVIASEISNIRAAFDWSIETAEHCESGATMVADLWFYWIGCGHLKEGRTLSELAWDRSHHFGRPQETRLLWTLAWNLLITGETSRAEQHLSECLVRSQEENDVRSIAYSHALLAAV
jgi:non-specific serine/threonine protein kinase